MAKGRYPAVAKADSLALDVIHAIIRLFREHKKLRAIGHRARHGDDEPRSACGR